MTFEIKKIEQPESDTHYKFTTYKTVKDKTGKSVEIKDREEQYTLKDLKNRLDNVQVQVDKWQEKIDAVNKLEK